MARSCLFPWQYDVLQDGPHSHVYTTRTRPGHLALCSRGCDDKGSPPWCTPFPSLTLCTAGLVRGALMTVSSLVTSPTAHVSVLPQPRTWSWDPGRRSSCHTCPACRPSQDGGPGRMVRVGGWWSSGQEAPCLSFRGSPVAWV